MTENRMYSQRTKQGGNIPVIRICNFDCTYCAFKRYRAMSKCQKCRDNIPHSHLEVLQRNPPRTKEGEFLTVGLSGDVSFMGWHDFCDVLTYCEKWNDRTFLIQSKNLEYFILFDEAHIIPKNVILGTTIETNREAICQGCGDMSFYQGISKAPPPQKRYEAMLKLNCKKAVTIEPILDFDLEVLGEWIKDIAPKFVYIGYDNHHHKLPEPPPAKTQELIARLRESGIEVREKTLRKAWYE